MLLDIFSGVCISSVFFKEMSIHMLHVSLELTLFCIGRLLITGSNSLIIGLPSWLTSGELHIFRNLPTFF